MFDLEKIQESKLNFSLSFFAATSNHRSFLGKEGNMVVNTSASAGGSAGTAAGGTSEPPTTADFRKQRAEMKKDLQRKFERWDKDTHDRTR